jgi:type IV pilus assembly protein PilV
MKVKSASLSCDRKNQRGFSMIEVLISLLLMTIGLVGISGLMLSGINNSTGFDLRSRASQSANEIMDAMRANSSNAGAYAVAYDKDLSSITGTDTASTDLKQWLQAVRRLPNGDGKIEVDATLPGVYLVSVRFSNCLGSISTSAVSDCKQVTSDVDKRTASVSFRFRI